MVDLEEGVRGPRHVLSEDDERFPEALKQISDAPRELWVVGDPSALEEGLAVVGARKATPYGRGCARRFAHRAAERGVVIISGGARGCDAEAHRAAIAAGTPTVVFLGGGCDAIYPVENRALFQEVVDRGGALVSEHDWTVPPLPYMFRARNRLIARLARATLIVDTLSRGSILFRGCHCDGKKLRNMPLSRGYAIGFTTPFNLCGGSERLGSTRWLANRSIKGKEQN